jgi:hypothetical protein
MAFKDIELKHWLGLAFLAGLFLFIAYIDDPSLYRLW